MSYHIDLKWLRILPLSQYEEKNNPPQVANFRCPICGDSKKSDTKKRCWALHNNGKKYISIKCHNCGASMTIKKLISDYFSSFYKEYIFDILKDRNQFSPEKKVKSPEEIFSKESKKEKTLNIPTIPDLPENHKARIYIKSRKIPLKFQYDIYYADDFVKWVNKEFDGKLAHLEGMRDSRIVFPLRNNDGEVFGINARTLKKNTSAKYITILKDGDYQKIFGLDRLQYNETCYVVEGPIDSFFLDNCVAVVGGLSGLEKYKNILPEKIVIVADREPRNADTVRNIENAIKLGVSVFIPPKSWEYKDLNEGIERGLTKEQIQNIVDKNSYKGVAARIKLAFWRKVNNRNKERRRGK